MKAPPFFLILIVLAAMAATFSFVRSFAKAARISPSPAGGIQQFEKRVNAETDVGKLRQMALERNRVLAAADAAVESMIRALRSILKSGITINAAIVVCAIFLYLELRVRR